jgi:hypothetical protein
LGDLATPITGDAALPHVPRYCLEVDILAHIERMPTDRFSDRGQGQPLERDAASCIDDALALSLLVFGAVLKRCRDRIHHPNLTERSRQRVLVEQITCHQLCASLGEYLRSSAIRVTYQCVDSELAGKQCVRDRAAMGACRSEYQDRAAHDAWAVLSIHRALRCADVGS